LAASESGFGQSGEVDVVVDHHGNAEFPIEHGAERDVAPAEEVVRLEYDAVANIDKPRRRDGDEAAVRRGVTTRWNRADRVFQGFDHEIWTEFRSDRERLLSGYRTIEPGLQDLHARGRDPGSNDTAAV